MIQNKRLFFAIAAGLVVMCFLVLIGIIALIVSTKNKAREQAEFNTFGSCGELADRLTTQYGYAYPYAVDGRGGMEDMAAASPTSADSTYSQTNVQVAGVDEADFIKTDGKYLYMVVGTSLRIIDVQDAANPMLVSETEIQGTPNNLFLNGSQVVVFSNSNHFFAYPFLAEDVRVASPEYWQDDRQETAMFVFDASNPAEPELTRTVKQDGYYQTARMVDNNIYLISNYTPYYYGEVDAQQAEALLPRLADVVGEQDVTTNDYQVMADCTDVSFYGQKGASFSTVTAIDLGDAATKSAKVLVGSAQTVYVSTNNLFLTTPVYDEEIVTPQPCNPLMSLVGICPVASDISILPPASQDVTTDLFKIQMDGLELKFIGSANVPGTLLNQFALDEQSGYLRVATTRNDWGGWTNDSDNNLYVLDQDMQQVGSLEGLAKGEQIYAVRFMGERAYLVTFEQVDPLFVIDLSVPAAPKLLGELEIPGFSNYLHPYDDTHIIGVGKEVDADTGVTGGLKIGLFDVTDPANPTEVSKLQLGEMYSDTEVTYEHKAFLFDREKQLLVIPVSLYEGAQPVDYYWQPSFSGFVVMNINLTDGITESGRVEHANDFTYYYTGSRSLYIGDDLITVANGAIKISDLNTLNLVGELAVTK